MGGFKGILFLWILSTSGWAQSNRYIVFFKDKNNNPYSITQPQAFLSARAITRRARIGVAVTAEDLPVTPSYISQISTIGAKTFFTSRWMNALLVETTPALIVSVGTLPFVLKTELVAPGNKLIGGRLKNVRQKNATNSPASTQTQLQMLGLDQMQADGFYGSGVTVSILDDGFIGSNVASPFQTIFGENRVNLTRDFVTNSGNVFQFDQHGTEVFSVIAALEQQTFTGGAYKANYLLFVTEDVSSEYRIEEYNWLFATEKADSAGTDIIQSSLGYNTFDDSKMDYKITDMDGKTAVISKAASMARDRGIIVVVSAGNEGNVAWHYVTAPADVDGILAVASVSASGIKSSFSSFGPTADGRIKPDVAALGQNTVVILPNGSLGSASGTSLAAPLVTSLATGLLQAYPELTPAEILLAIKLSASQGNAPDNQLGFGVPNYIAVKNYLESNQPDADVFIFPNPATSTLSLTFKKLPDGPVDLSFYDLDGRLLSNPVSSLNWLNNPLEISIANLAAGSYFLKIKTSAILRTFRFVKL